MKQYYNIFLPIASLVNYFASHHMRAITISITNSILRKKNIKNSILYDYTIVLKL